jgi:hypothetical protein
MKEFVLNNIEKINERISDFKEANPNATEIKNYLAEKFYKEIENNREILLQELSENNFLKSKIKDIANKYCYYKSHLESFYKSSIFQKVFSHINLANFTEKFLDEFRKNASLSEKEIRFVEKDLTDIISKTLFIASKNGFSSDLQNIESGLRIANEGDSAQFLFVARAILAGFNCSNVDVRSSRYDAIIDYKGKLLRVQIKGISENNNISFFDRDRGGQGIDHKHERNKGKRITGKDCDLYVAIDKQVGMCYIIPMSFADKLHEENARNVKLETLEQFLENWNIIMQTAELLK